MIKSNPVYDSMWSDISPSFDRAWNHDVQESKGLESVNNSIYGILTTRPGSRPFMPDFGCDLGSSLFENMNPITADQARTSIIAALAAYEPRIISNVVVKNMYDENMIQVTVFYSILETPGTINEFTMVLSE